MLSNAITTSVNNRLANYKWPQIPVSGNWNIIWIIYIYILYTYLFTHLTRISHLSGNCRVAQLLKSFPGKASKPWKKARTGPTALSAGSNLKVETEEEISKDQGTPIHQKKQNPVVVEKFWRTYF